MAGLTETVRHLIHEADADIHGPDGRYGNSLQAASRRGHKDVVQLLLSSRADVNALSGENQTSALWAATASGHQAIVELLLRSGADVNTQVFENNHSVIRDAIKASNRPLRVPFFDTTKTQLESPLHTASWLGHKAIVALLLEAGADVNALAFEGSGTTLYFASIFGHKAVVQLLLNAGAEVNARGCRDEETAIYIASFRGHKETVELLIAAGAEVNSQNCSAGHSAALYAAARLGDEETVRTLIAAGANIDGQDDQLQCNTLRLASDAGHETEVKPLGTAGTDVDAPFCQHRTPLIAASSHGHTAVVKLLLLSGAKVDAQGSDHPSGGKHSRF